MRVGCAASVITPPLGISLAGFGARHEGARGIHDDLFARALVLEEDLEDGNMRLALVACDLCEVDAPFVAHVRQRIEQSTGIPPTHVMIAATHAHAAPATFALYSAPPDPAWLRELGDRVASAVEQAARDLAPATMALCEGREASIGRNRRRPDGPTDPTVTVLRFDRAGAPPALLLNYACHPTVLGPDNLLISRDYVGFAVDALERAMGGWAIFTNGACGDVNVGHSADRSALGLPIGGRTLERAEALGLRLAVEALRVAGATSASAGRGLLAAAQRAVDVPLRATPSLEDARERVRACQHHLKALEETKASEDAATAARLELLYAELALEWVEQRGPVETEPAELQAFAIGDVALVALPGEFFAESGLRLKRQSPFPHTIAVGYANGGIGYVPPAPAFAEGGYETRLAPWSRVAPEAEAKILAAAVDLLERLRAKLTGDVQ